MPLGDIAAGLFEIVIRVVGEILLEIIVKGPGYIIVRLFTTPKNREVEPDGVLVIAVGVAFWVLIGAGVFFIYLVVSGE